ncbi:MAG: ABC transporter ATP-binding protein [Rubricella sp.]
MGTILSVENLNKSYGATHVLHDINVSIEEGEFLVLVGPSGCGKSTLLNCIAGLEDITSGTIRIGGTDMTGVSPKDRDIAMVFQSYALYPTMTVAKNITFGLQVRGVDRATQDAKLKEVADLLQITPYLNRKPSQLSGGQRQRVAMGRALVRDPQLFLFDEPLSNLDAKLRVEMRTEIKRLHQQLGASIVYVTHDQIEAMTLATKIVVLKGGVVQQAGSPAEIYNRPANAFVADFMGSPAMNLIPARVMAHQGQTRIEIERVGEEPLILTDPSLLPGLNGSAQEVTLGLRPEDITDVGNVRRAGDQVADCLIDVVEPAGADTFVVTELGGRRVTARLHSEAQAHAGQHLPLSFDLARASYFAADTGERLN